MQREKVCGVVGLARAGIPAARFLAERGATVLGFDAKPRAAGALPGGNGLPFDWRLLAGLDPGLPFMLSGGLTSDNVAAALALTGARAVDVSSGVESRPGQKDPAKIEAFVRAARTAWSASLSEGGLKP